MDVQRTRRTRRAATGAALVTTALVAGCSVVGGDGGGSAEDGSTVVLVTHDSFALPDELVEAFEADTGYELEQRAPGDSGALVNQLVLTADSPLGDVVYGVDSTFASRAIDAGVLEEYRPDGFVEELAVDDGAHLTPVDVGDVCVNVDREWFATQGLPEPATLEDLADPAYRDLLVVTNPATSSPGLAFLLATVAEYGEGWTAYWERLRDNGVKVVDGWSDAYFVDFSGSSGEGDRPLVLSYASSPPAEAGDADEAPTAALLDTCYRQVEYAGVLAGAANPEGARAVVDWLLSPEVQAALPEAMYVYPVREDVDLPESWARHAPLPEDPYTLPSDEVAEHREEWIQTWTDVVVG